MTHEDLARLEQKADAQQGELGTGIIVTPRELRELCVAMRDKLENDHVESDT